MASYPFNTVITTVPPIEVFGVNISYEEILTSLAAYYYSIQKIFLEAGNHSQVSNPIEFTKYDSNGLQNTVVINPNIDPYSKQPSMLVDLNDYVLSMNGRLEMGLTMQPEEWMRVTFFTCRAYLAKCLDQYTDIPNAGNTDTLFDFWLTIRSNVDAIVNISLMNIGAIRGAFNSTTTFRADLTGADLTLVPDVSIAMKANGSSDLTIYTAPILDQTPQGIADALNTLNVGVFWVEGNVVVSSNSLYTYDRIMLGANSAPVWSVNDQTMQIAQTSQTRHICDFAFDADGGALDVTFVNLPSFCIPQVLDLPGITGGGTMKIIDITVTPGAGDSGTYNFIMRASDGIETVDKTVTLLVDTNNHFRYVVRNGPVSFVNEGAGLQSLGSLTNNLQGNGTQQTVYPTANIDFVFSSGPGNMNPRADPFIPSQGRYILIRQNRNAAADGSRYGDSTFFVVNVVVP